MQFLDLANLIVKDWGLLLLFFTAGISFYKAKAWVDHLHDDIEGISKKLDQINERLGRHDAELIRNTEQHTAIVKALDGHVLDNRNHDVEVKNMLSVILDRLK